METPFLLHLAVSPQEDGGETATPVGPALSQTGSIMTMARKDTTYDEAGDR